MKIDPTLKTAAPAAIDERLRSPRQDTPQSGGKPRGDVQLSSLSSHLQEIEAGLEGAAVDSRRVAEVKRSIADGSFHVNAEKVADRLIEATRDVLRTRQS